MGKTVKKTGLLLMIFILLFVFMFGATGCSGSYNKGYKKLYDFVKKNNISTDKEVIQYSKVVEETYFIFTSSGKSSGILVSVGDSERYDGVASKISFSIEKKGISNDNFLTVEISTDKNGDYYYKGTTQIMSTKQTSFAVFDIKESRERNGSYTDISNAKFPAAVKWLKLIVEKQAMQLCDFIEGAIGIPIELFEGK